MISAEFRSYFGSYARTSDLRDIFLRWQRGEPVEISVWLEKSFKEMRSVCELDPEAQPITKENYPRLYGVIQKECAFRGVPIPDVYVAEIPDWGLFSTTPHLNTIIFPRHAWKKFTDVELHWIVAHELKHLYQAGHQNPEEYLANERDADRSAVESAGYDAALSHFIKEIPDSTEVGNLQSKPLKGALLKLYNAFPRFVTEHFYLNSAPYHYDSVAVRLKDMREHLDQLAQPDVI